jgi:hypothetical protein
MHRLDGDHYQARATMPLAWVLKRRFLAALGWTIRLVS